MTRPGIRRSAAAVLEAEPGQWFTIRMLVAEVERRVGRAVSERAVYRAVQQLVEAGAVSVREVGVMFGQANGGARPRRVQEVSAA